MSLYVVVCIHVRTYVHMYVCIYIYIYIHTYIRGVPSEKQELAWAVHTSFWRRVNITHRARKGLGGQWSRFGAVWCKHDPPPGTDDSRWCSQGAPGDPILSHPIPPQSNQFTLTTPYIYIYIYIHTYT